MNKKKLHIHLAEPRGFCAGVERAILIVEKALALYKPPVYVRHEIVHNQHVVRRLKKMGAIFVKELDEVEGNYPVIFSAHGVPKSVPEMAKKKNLIHIDATCPLVSKVHRETERYEKEKKHIILIGHKGHPEVIGTMGQVDGNNITLVENIHDVEQLSFHADTPLAYATQTTLSIDDTQHIIQALRKKFHHIQGPNKEDICYATTNRQAAVKKISERSDLLLVMGSQNSSNSKRLIEVGIKAGVKKAYLIEDHHFLDLAWFENIENIGLSAGASAPEYLIENVLEYLLEYFALDVHHVKAAHEDTRFNLPKML